jgi:hypothetical protein
VTAPSDDANVRACASVPPTTLPAARPLKTTHQLPIASLTITRIRPSTITTVVVVPAGGVEPPCLLETICRSTREQSAGFLGSGGQLTERRGFVPCARVKRHRLGPNTWLAQASPPFGYGGPFSQSPISTMGLLSSSGTRGKRSPSNVYVTGSEPCGSAGCFSALARRIFSACSL